MSEADLDLALNRLKQRISAAAEVALQCPPELNRPPGHDLDTPVRLADIETALGKMMAALIAERGDFRYRLVAARRALRQLDFDTDEHVALYARLKSLDDESHRTDKVADSIGYPGPGDLKSALDSAMVPQDRIASQIDDLQADLSRYESLCDEVSDIGQKADADSFEKSVTDVFTEQSYERIETARGQLGEEQVDVAAVGEEVSALGRLTRRFKNTIIGAGTMISSALQSVAGSVDSVMSGVARSARVLLRASKNSTDEIAKVGMSSVGAEGDLSPQKYYYVSCASQDYVQIRPIIDALLNRGVPLWIERPHDLGLSEDRFFDYMRPGGNWKMQLRAALSGAVGILCFPSPAFDDSMERQEELAFALDLAERSGDRFSIFPVISDRLSPWKVSKRFQHLHQFAVDLTDLSDVRVIDQLANELLEKLQYRGRPYSRSPDLETFLVNEDPAGPDQKTLFRWERDAAVAIVTGQMIPEPHRPYLRALDISGSNAHLFADLIEGGHKLSAYYEDPTVRATRGRRLIIDDLSPLSDLVGLQRLSLARTPIHDISVLSNLRQLRELSLLGVRVQDISPLSMLRELRSLNLRDTAVSNVSALSGMLKLEHLDLGGTPVANVAPLSDLPKLRDLNLYGTRVRNTQPVNHVREIRYKLGRPWRVRRMSK